MACLPYLCPSVSICGYSSHVFPQNPVNLTIKITTSRTVRSIGSGTYHGGDSGAILRATVFFGAGHRFCSRFQISDIQVQDKLKTHHQQWTLYLYHMLLPYLAATRSLFFPFARLPGSPAPGSSNHRFLVSPHFRVMHSHPGTVPRTPYRSLGMILPVFPPRGPVRSCELWPGPGLYRSPWL